MLRRKGLTRTGPTADTVLRAMSRDGYRCVVCGRMLTGTRGVDWSLHHRLPRRMGGTKRPEVNRPSALLVVCGSGTTGCHGWIVARRTEALDMGLLLHAGDNPAEVPVHLAVGLVYLTDEGTYRHVS